MAINSFSLDVPTEETSPKAQLSPNSTKYTNLGSRRLVKINFAAADESISSPKNKYLKQKPMKNGLHIVSRVTEKTYTHKRESEFSSFPLANNLYRTNSDEIKHLKTSSRKVKKSVLTLPNDPAPKPQLCTVSDINDSEFCTKDSVSVIKPKKRTPVTRNKKNRSKFRDLEFYDRDADYDIDLNYSSTAMIKGDGKKPKCGSHRTDDSTANVWTVLRNINRFQFRPSPPLSEDSFVMPNKKRRLKKRNNKKDLRFVETCHTEQIAYIADFDIESGSPKSVSQTSSFDRVTVIEKQNELENISKEYYEKRKLKHKTDVRSRIQINRANTKNNRALTRKPNNNQYAKNTNVIRYIDKHIIGDNEYNDVLSIEDANVHGYENDLINCDELTINYDSTDKVNDRKLVLTKFRDSEHLGSSKAACSKENLNVDTVNCDGKVLRHCLPLNSPKVDGITKVVLHKGRKAFNPDRLRMGIPPQINTRLNNPVPKQNQTDIRRRVAKLNFPIVILGKDQLSSNYEVIEEEPFQFSGLNKKVWPFMLDWYEDETETAKLKLKNNSRFSSNKNPHISSFISHKKAQKIVNNNSNVNKELSVSNKRDSIEFKNINRNRIEPKRITPPHELSHQIKPPRNVTEESLKQKPMRQFKDKMLRFIYKKPNITDDTNETGEHDDSMKKKLNRERIKMADVETDPEVSLHAINVVSIPVDKHHTIVKYSWCKSRWANDFIDNIIRKIKTGVYYTSECKASNTHPEMKEAAIQTIKSMAVATHFDSLQSISKIRIKNKFDPHNMVIPGFENDNMIPELEIESLSMNVISVKHCTTKILVHFDIASPTESVISMKKSSSLIPLTITESHTKVFKYKTSILNSMLPEEICTILPNIMTNIIKTNECLALSPVTVDKPDFNLFPIPEVSRSRSPETISNSIFSIRKMSTNLQTLLNGLFSSPKSLKPTSITPFEYDLSSSIELLPCLERSHFFNCNVNPLIFIYIARFRPAVKIIRSLIRPVKNTCMALQPYPAYDQRIVSAYKRFDFVGILLIIFSIRDILLNRIEMKTIPWTNTALSNITIIKLTVSKPDGLEDSFVFDVSKMINAIRNPNEVYKGQKHFVRKYLRFIGKDNVNRNVEKKSVRIHASVLNKVKKKGFVKLYRKCKSCSSIAGEIGTIPLNKINNLDDFVSVLGTGKLLAGAFDRHLGQKILSSVVEMRNWSNELNPRQALLVVLLNNKKDTPNLVRFKPVLLQGIAMNRITRANELDMEIEVIERENLCRTKQYEGISYLPASAENQDTLFEELCWIAKTTASDYHRIFDESSEKLLKSLLQKRKRLNPSYLRVMARYVGLGLLQSPVKK